MNTLKKITLAAGLVLAATINAQEPKPQVATQAPAAKQEAPAKQPAERWEYRHTVAFRDGMPEEDKMLNVIGAQGWELVSVNVESAGQVRGVNIWHYTFKRKL